jgi:D-3-phosphoglycerate dehydrogenase
MKPRAILINTVRAIVDEPAVIDARTNGHLSHAGLNVFQTEPLPANHPLTKPINAVCLPPQPSA